MRGGAGVPTALPSIPRVVPLPADGKYWCCDFINKGFCEPEKHGIRMNYFLSCRLARFANLGVFGPSPGNKPKFLSKRHRCSREGEKKPRNDAPVPPSTAPCSRRSGPCRWTGEQGLLGLAFPEGAWHCHVPSAGLASQALQGQMAETLTRGNPTLHGVKWRELGAAVLNSQGPSHVPPLQGMIFTLLASMELSEISPHSSVAAGLVLLASLLSVFTSSSSGAP